MTQPVNRELEAYMADMVARVETSLTEGISQNGGTLEQAIHYALKVRGKRLRPLIFLTLIDALGGDSEQHVELASAIEYIHTYSLIHDDLPAMDNDDFRRGKPTVHKKFNDAMALLAGDTLLTMAFEKIAGHTGLDAEKKIRFIQIITRSIGILGMAGGQALDLEFSGQTDLIARIHRMKTGELIRAVMVAAAEISGVEGERLHALNEAGKSIGEAFQLADDLLDLDGDEAVVGKKLHKDKDNHSPNAALFFGREHVRKSIDRAYENTIKHLRMAEIEDPAFLDLMRMMVYRKR